MDINYLNARDKIHFLKKDLEKIQGKADYEGMENSECCTILERLIEELENAERSIEYYSKPVKEGRLIKLSNGRFELCNIELTCGSSLEIYDDEEKEWVHGRVEHTRSDGQEGYYFYGGNKPFLHEGMKARKRE